jgi:hypothetical protein
VSGGSPIFRSLFKTCRSPGFDITLAICNLSKHAAPARRGLLAPAALMVLVSVADASVEQRERWTLSSASGTASLALVQEPAGRPLIMFICGARLPGYAELVVSAGPEDLSARRLRMDIEVGSVTAMASAQWSSGTSTAPSIALTSIPVQKMTKLMKANASTLSWRVEVSDRFDLPLASAPMPSPFGRHDTEFLCLCA